MADADSAPMISRLDVPERGRGVREVAVIALLLVVFGGALTWFSALTAYKGTPGPTGNAPTSWPSKSALPRPVGRPTLVLFAHPRCPCTSASLHELKTALETSGWGGNTIVAMTRPTGVGREWLDTRHHHSARAIPGVLLLDDLAGSEGRRFGAMTSGHVVLYDEAGVLRFSGGITPLRGHEGDNAGRQLLVARLRERTATALALNPVFGCELEDAPGALR